MHRTNTCKTHTISPQAVTAFRVPSIWHCWDTTTPAQQAQKAKSKQQREAVNISLHPPPPPRPKTPVLRCAQTPVFVHLVCSRKSNRTGRPPTRPKLHWVPGCAMAAKWIRIRLAKNSKKQLESLRVQLRGRRASAVPFLKRKGTAGGRAKVMNGRSGSLGPQKEDPQIRIWLAPDSSEEAYAWAKAPKSAHCSQSCPTLQVTAESWKSRHVVYCKTALPKTVKV